MKKLILFTFPIILLAVACNKTASSPIGESSKIYNNNQYHYQVQTLSGYTVTPGSKDGSLIIISQGHSSNSDNFNNFTITVTKPNIKSFDDYIQRRYKIIHTLDITAEQKNVKVNNYAAVQLLNHNSTTCSPAGSESDVPCKGITTLWQYQGSVYEISGTAFNSSDYQVFTNVYNQILNSFKYTQ